ncbi:MAG: helix-turn-helix domain-containing protein [Acidobacteriia bacterium]|nr:helix-turn-helix domain-containing protein [Terriglobia bacterium]
MSTQTVNALAYGRLLANVQPRAIKDQSEYDRLVNEVGRLMERGERKLTAEETSLLEVLSILIEEFDREHYKLPASKPHQFLAFLLEQRGLKPRDLWPVLGSKSRVSEILSGKRAISKAQAKKLASFFHVPVGLFI